MSFLVFVYLSRVKEAIEVEKSPNGGFMSENSLCKACPPRLPEIYFINPSLLAKKRKPIIICDADKGIRSWAYFGFRKSCPSRVVKNVGLSAVLLEGLALHVRNLVF
jgi:hypothetical protein